MAVNGIFPKPSDLPKYIPSDIVGVSYDELGKFIQRIKSVNALTPEIYKHVLDIGGFPTDGVDDLDYSDKGGSRAGESMGSSGTGNTQSGGASSSTNMENKSLKLLEDRKDDGERIYVDVNDSNKVYILHE